MASPLKELLCVGDEYCCWQALEGQAYRCFLMDDWARAPLSSFGDRVLFCQL